MHTAVQISVEMPNQPGSLAKVTDKLRAVDVNIEALYCTEGDPATALHLIVDDTETAKMVLRDMGEVSTTDVFAFHMKNRPGAIAKIARTCAGANINIRNIYASTGGKKEATVYLLVDDIEKAKVVFGKTKGL